MNSFYLDFETRSHLNIKNVGAYAYCAHPSTEILCMAWAVDDSPVEIITKDMIDMGGLISVAGYMELALLGGVKFKAFNAFFERCVWLHLIPRYELFLDDTDKYTKLHNPKYWECMQAKCAMHALPVSLDKATQALKLPVQKDMVGHRIMMKLARPKKKKGVITGWNEKSADFDALYSYCKDDVITERLIDKRLDDLPKSEKIIWHIDQTINDRGLAVNMGLVNKAIEYNILQSDQANDEMSEITDGMVPKTTAVGKIKEFLGTQGLKVTCLDAQAVENMLDGYGPMYNDKVYRVLELRRDNSKSSIAKYQKMVDTQVNSRVHGTTRYHIAGTGRWGGALVQPHNFPRGTIKFTDVARCLFETSPDIDTLMVFYPEISDLLSSLLRSMVVPTEGCEFITADYKSIEARILSWMAGDTVMCKKFANNEDVYVDMARVIYNCKEISDDQRFVGKQATLGCGYGMAWMRFQAQCAAYGVIISDELAKAAVKAYRRRMQSVVRLWYSTEKIVKQALTDALTVQNNGVIYARYDGEFLKLRIPSGRILYYYNPTIEDGDITYWTVSSQARKWMQVRTWGGKLVENVDQAVARDILANALRNLWGTRYKVELHVHDEIVASVKKGQGNVDEFCQLLCDTPKWAKGCPIDAEGWFGSYYIKG